MSKAFTKDEAGPAEAVRRPPEAGLRYITPEGHAALRAELAQRLEERKAIAASPGALDVKERTAELDARIAFLQATLEATRVVRPDPAQRGRASLGAWVTLEDEDGQTQRYRLVGPDEADAREGKVSVDSPLGKALLGRGVDDEVSVERPRGRTTYLLAAIDYPEEGAARSGS